MQGSKRLFAVLVNGLFLASLFLALFVPQATATPGRDSAAQAADCATGPFEGYYDGGSYVAVGPPVVEDYYRCMVWQGQIFQAALWAYPNSMISVHRSVNGTLIEFARSFAIDGVNVGGIGPVGLADMTLVIYRTETLYIKVTPPGGAGLPSQLRYNLYFRAFNATVLEAGSSLTAPATDDSINGWQLPWVFGYRYTDDYYWVNATDGMGGNHLNYRVTLNQDCSTAMYDIFLYRYLDYPSERLDYVNHSFAMERRVTPTGLTTIPNSFEFAPSTYDGLYLLQVHAVENGTYSANSPNRYTYSLAVSTVGGYAKDGNDRKGDGQTLTITQTVAGNIDQRDDSADWVRLQLLAGDSVTMGARFLRPVSSDVATMGLRYRVIVYAPNGTVMADADNWGVSGGNLYFNPYLTVGAFTAGEAGIYEVGIFTTDGILNSFNAAVAAGGVGRNWAGWELQASLPNRPPFFNTTMAFDHNITMNEDGEYRMSLVGSYVDPEGKVGYPTYGPAVSSANLSVTIGQGVVTVRPVADWFGTDSFTVTVKDDDSRNNQMLVINVTVFPVNDEPRTRLEAANFSIVSLDEDGSASVPLQNIFWDVDDTTIAYTAGGITTTRADVVINNASHVATITPDLNWNGDFEITWTATDPLGLLRDFTSQVRVREVNDPPRATDTRLPRITINEGQDFFINLSSHFFDFDFEDGDTLRYYGAVDQSVAEFIRVNNTNLDPSDPNMRVYVVDQYRSQYFTNGPIPIKFWVLDSANNVDGKNGIPVVVEKTTFLEIVNVNDAPIIDEVQPAPSEVAINEYQEGDSITFAVTRVVDPDNTFFPDTDTNFIYTWYVNEVPIIGATKETFVFRTVLDATQTGQFAAGHYVVRVEVQDPAGLQAQQSPQWEFNVYKTNRRPTLQLLQPTQTTFEEGTPIEFEALINDEDPEDSNLSVTWKYIDARGNEVVIGDKDEFVSHLEPGTYNLVVEVSDGIQTVEREFTLKVEPHKLNTPGFEGALGVVAMLGVALAVGAVRGKRRE